MATWLEKVLADVTPTLRMVGNWSGVSYATMRAYRLGTRNPTPATARRLAKALDRQAKRLARHAQRCREYATTAGAAARRRRRG